MPWQQPAVMQSNQWDNNKQCNYNLNNWNNTPIFCVIDSIATPFDVGRAPHEHPPITLCLEQVQRHHPFLRSAWFDSGRFGDHLREHFYWSRSIAANT